MAEYTLTPESRNLGYGWNNKPAPRMVAGVQRGFWIPPPESPNVRGGLTIIAEEREHAHRVNTGNGWNEMLFVAGERIVARWAVSPRFDDNGEPVLDGFGAHHCDWGWKELCDSEDITEILEDLRSGALVRVKTAAAGEKEA